MHRKVNQQITTKVFPVSEPGSHQQHFVFPASEPGSHQQHFVFPAYEPGSRYTALLFLGVAESGLGKTTIKVVGYFQLYPAWRNAGSIRR